MENIAVCYIYSKCHFIKPLIEIFDCLYMYMWCIPAHGIKMDYFLAAGIERKDGRKGREGEGKERKEGKKEEKNIKKKQKASKLSKVSDTR